MKLATFDKWCIILLISLSIITCTLGGVLVTLQKIQEAAYANCINSVMRYHATLVSKPVSLQDIKYFGKLCKNQE